VNQIIKQKSRYLSEFAKIQSMSAGSAKAMRGMTLKRFRRTSMSSLNHVLEQFVAESRLNQWTLTGPKLKQKAREVAVGMGLSDFKASNGWLDSFKKRCSLEFNSGKMASGRRSNQENRSDMPENDSHDLNNNNHNHNYDDLKVYTTLAQEGLNDQVCDCRMDVSPFNLMDLNDDADKVQNQLTSSSITSSSPHSSSELNFTAESSVPTVTALDLHFTTDGIPPERPATSGLRVDDFRADDPVLMSNTGTNDNCPNQSEWMIGFETNDDTATTTAPSPDSDRLPHADHSLHQAHHLLPHSHSHPHHHQQQLAVQLQPSQLQQQHSHPEQQTLADGQPQLPENLHLNSLPHTLSLPSDQMIQLQLSGHMDDGSPLTADSMHHKLNHSSPQPVSNQLSASSGMMSQDMKPHCPHLLTVNTSISNGNCDSTASRNSPSSVKCHHTDLSSSQIEVPAIADVRSAIDTLERFALTKMPPLLSSILCIRQEVGNFVIHQQVIQQQQQQDQCNHHQHQIQQQQQQQQQQPNHQLNQ
jgi:hypothetical protein